MMLEKLKYFINDVNYTDHESLYKQAQKICHEMFSHELANLKMEESAHDLTPAMEELGLEQELIEQLIEDYVEQVIKSIVQFEKHLKGLQELKESELRLDYTQFRELAHKNLGVARNLRIQDAQVLLYELMKKDDLDYLVTCLEALKYCTIKITRASQYSDM